MCSNESKLKNPSIANADQLCESQAAGRPAALAPAPVGAPAPVASPTPASASASASTSTSTSTSTAKRRVLETGQSFIVRAMMVAGLAGAGVPSLSAAVSAPAPEPGWVSAWSAAAQEVPPPESAPSFNKAPDTVGKSVRQIVYPAIGGSQVRIRLTNAFGTAPLTLRSITISDAGRGADVAPGTIRSVTFGGKPGVTISPGSSVWSDPVAETAGAGRPLAISFAAPDNGVATTWHKVANQVSYVSGPGDASESTDAAPYRTRITSYVWLDRLAVQAPGAHAVVAIGDSITDGMRSTLNANRRWPDRFASLVAAGAGDAGVSVVNAGISGNRLLHDSPCYGKALETRFAADALDQPGVRDVITLIGINDINFGWMPAHGGLDCDVPHVRVTSADLIQGYQRLIAAAHQHHVQIVGGTLTPASLPPDREQIRTEVNAWIRSSHAFDRVIDFDAALRDPSAPTRLLPKYDSNDHVHPSDAGYQRMAEAAWAVWSAK